MFLNAGLKEAQYETV